MAHHKRKKPKHQRAGCIFCKPHKDDRVKKVPKPSDLRRQLAAEQDRKAVKR